MFNFRLVDLFFLSVALLASSACSVSSNAQKPRDIPQNQSSLHIAATDAPQEAWTKEFDGFRFRAFASREDDREAFRRMFPQGTTRAFVEHVLIKKAGARIGRDGSDDARDRTYFLVSYVEPRTFLRGEKGPWSHLFLYDKNWRILNIKPFGKQDLYDVPRTCDLFKHPLNRC